MALQEPLRRSVTDFASQLLETGFWGLSDVTEATVSQVPAADQSDVITLVQTLWQERLAEQAAWPDTGDYGRLQRLFADLESESIVARMFFSCCGSCAYHDIADEATWESPSEVREVGYVYFPPVEAEGLGHPESVLNLHYGSFKPHPDLPSELLAAAAAGDDEARSDALHRTDAFVAARLVDMASDHGLTAQWSGSTADTVRVRVPQWRKPLPSQ